MASLSTRIGRYAHEYYLPAVASVLIAVCALLLWFGYTSTSEWQRSMQLLADQRASETLTLMIMALSRDMRGVQSQVLPQLESFDIQSARYALANEIAIAFARFPYPESFFNWTWDKQNDGTLYVFSRSDRPPPWLEYAGEGARFPVTIIENPQEVWPLIQVIRRQASLLKPLVIFETDIQGHRYQAIARLRYGGPADTSLLNIIGFMVNIDWAREHYFSEMTSQLSQILAGQTNTALTIMDENNMPVSTNEMPGTGRVQLEGAMREERFPLLFFEPSLKAAAQHGTLPERFWTARATAFLDDSMQPVRSARRMFIMIAIATIAAGVGLILTVRALRSAQMLATMKSEFVSAVTHELKTPLSSISLAVQTLVKGRVRSEDTTEYAGLLLNAVSRLNRTVDNLLSVARVHDVPAFYNFESLDLMTVLEQALDRFQPHLKELSFQVDMDVPPYLPLVKADRTAVLQVFDNIIDNAIRYSNGTRVLKVSAMATARRVRVEITDHGSGIPRNELPLVFDKFFRGSNTAAAGSGLGLAIARRVIEDHGGEIRVRSTEGMGTTVEVALNLAHEEMENETTHTGR